MKPYQLGLLKKVHFKNTLARIVPSADFFVLLQLPDIPAGEYTETVRALHEVGVGLQRVETGPGAFSRVSPPINRLHVAYKASTHTSKGDSVYFLHALSCIGILRKYQPLSPILGIGYGSQFGTRGLISEILESAVLPGSSVSMFRESLLSVGLSPVMNLLSVIDSCSFSMISSVDEIPK